MRPIAFNGGYEIENKLVKILEDSNIPYEKDIGVDGFNVDFVVNGFWAIELTTNNSPSKMESLCFRSSILKESYMTTAIVPFSKLTRYGIRLLLNHFHYILDTENMNKTNIKVILRDWLNYFNYLERKARNYPKLAFQIKKFIKEKRKKS